MSNHFLKEGECVAVRFARVKEPVFANEVERRRAADAAKSKSQRKKILRMPVVGQSRK